MSRGEFKMTCRATLTHDRPRSVKIAYSSGAGNTVNTVVMFSDIGGHCFPTCRTPLLCMPIIVHEGYRGLRAETCGCD
jgi:hypothetical protein